MRKPSSPVANFSSQYWHSLVSMACLPRQAPCVACVHRSQHTVPAVCCQMQCQHGPKFAHIPVAHAPPTPMAKVTLMTALAELCFAVR